MTQQEEKCMANIPTYDEDGTIKDRDYWIMCLKDKPCPIHDNPAQQEDKLREVKVEYKGKIYRVTEVVIDMPECAVPQRKDVNEVNFLASQRQVLLDKILKIVTHSESLSDAKLNLENFINQLKR